MREGILDFATIIEHRQLESRVRILEETLEALLRCIASAGMDAPEPLREAAESILVAGILPLCEADLDRTLTASARDEQGRRLRGILSRV